MHNTMKSHTILLKMFTCFILAKGSNASESRYDFDDEMIVPDGGGGGVLFTILKLFCLCSLAYPRFSKASCLSKSCENWVAVIQRFSSSSLYWTGACWTIELAAPGAPCSFGKELLLEEVLLFLCRCISSHVESLSSSCPPCKKMRHSFRNYPAFSSLIWWSSRQQEGINFGVLVDFHYSM